MSSNMEILLSSSMEEIDLAYREAAGGISSKRPVIEMTIPSVLDKAISPPGMHVSCSLIIAVALGKIYSANYLLRHISLSQNPNRARNYMGACVVKLSYNLTATLCVQGNFVPTLTSFPSFALSFR